MKRFPGDAGAPRQMGGGRAPRPPRGPEHNLIQRPDLSGLLAQRFGMKQAHITPTLSENVQPVVLVDDISNHAALTTYTTRGSRQELILYDASGVGAENALAGLFVYPNTSVKAVLDHATLYGIDLSGTGAFGQFTEHTSSNNLSTYPGTDFTAAQPCTFEDTSLPGVNTSVVSFSTHGSDPLAGVRLLGAHICNNLGVITIDLRGVILFPGSCWYLVGLPGQPVQLYGSITFDTVSL